MVSDRCPLCGKGPDVCWLGGYDLGEYTVCVDCYEDLPKWEDNG